MTKRTAAAIGIGVVLIVGTFMLLETVNAAREANGADGFPLDDPWIHLQFAKNIHEYGSFSYYKDQQVTSGSTSPLYTLLLALGMVFTNNEFVLSYVLGGAFVLASALVMFRIAQLLFGHRILASLSAAAFVVLEPRLLWVSLSGMETTLFIALSLAAYLWYLERRPLLLGLGAGLLLWTRPEALLMITVLGADALYHRVIAREARGSAAPEHRQRPQWLIASGLVLGICTAGYAAFNTVLSGSLLPNTVAAKLKYYAAGGEAFPQQVLRFLSADHMLLVAPLLASGVLTALVAVLRRRRVPLLVPLLWCLAMVAAYWWKLPYLFQYGRYLMPIIPFALLLAFGGLDTLLEVAQAKITLLRKEQSRAAVQSLALLAVLVMTAQTAWQRRDYYSEACRYISERQVATALWVRGHVPADAIVATHDVGALAYYSGRRIVDMVGLISPEMIGNIGRIDKLVEYLKTQNVTHVAVLRSWFEITNVHPLFMTNELRPEVMEVFRFDPARMHFTNQTASMLSERARLELASGNVQQAGAMLEQALQYDTNSARIHLLLGRALLLVGRLDDADREFVVALRLQPDQWDARFGRADVAARRSNPREAIAMLEQLIQDNPDYSAGFQALAQLYYRSRIDTAKAAVYLRRFNELTRGDRPEPAR